ncbi:MAG TPA: site-2 protease family protein, partial [Candidatus Paceibacterota bacterium]|nr:site-2 protease family protein [Candidatus Paceibacterota bacterium]
MMTTFLAFILVLAILVIAHELGHFLAARKNGIKVDEFGFGFPPRIGGLRQENGHWKFYWGNREVAEDTHTLYSLNWIPLGGFVKIKGEDG